MSKKYISKICLARYVRNISGAKMLTKWGFPFFVNDDGIRYRIKNVNEEGENRVWRYHRYDSYCHVQQKRATMVAILRKLHVMASDNEQLWYSGVQKLYEFEQLGYPRSLRTYACATLAKSTGNTTWFRIRDEQ